MPGLWKNLYRQHTTTKIQCANPDPEIVNFINLFFCRAPFSNSITNRTFFLNGNCYWFAVILKERFKDYLPTIWYDAINNHFYTEIKGILYDANPLCAYIPSTPINYDSFYIWEDYKKFDPTHAKRIEAQCINFTWEDEN